MVGIGPMRDMTIGDPVSSAPGSHDRRGPPHLVACSGQGKHGALTVLRRNLVPELIVQVPQGTYHSSKCQAGRKLRAEWKEKAMLFGNDSVSVLRVFPKAITMQMHVNSLDVGSSTTTATIPFLTPPPLHPPTHPPPLGSQICPAKPQL